MNPRPTDFDLFLLAIIEQASYSRPRLDLDWTMPDEHRFEENRTIASRLLRAEVGARDDWEWRR